MNIHRIVLLMLAVFILEGALVPWIIPTSLADRLFPHFNFVLVIFAAIFSSRHYALGLGLGFGLLQDIMYYGNAIGIHFFFMGIIGYGVGIVFERKRLNVLVVISIIGIAYLAYDCAVYGINYVFKLVNGSFPWALLTYILPSLFFQLLFAILVYIPARKMFEKLVLVNYSETTEENL
jgi:rod shape-determining protein MreD